MAHIAPTKLYVFIFVSLLFLTGSTVYVATEVNLGHAGNITLGLIIAAVKACLVALFFMHLKYDAKEDISIRYFAIFPLILFCIVLIGVYPDVALKLGDRKPLPIEERVIRPPLPVEAEGHGH